jgi:hypothetical protein
MRTFSHVPFGVGKEKIHPSIGFTSFVCIFIYDSVYHHQVIQEITAPLAQNRHIKLEEELCVLNQKLIIG